MRTDLLAAGLATIVCVAAQAHRINPNTYPMGLTKPVWSADGRYVAIRDETIENGGIDARGPVCVFDAHSGRLLDRTHEGTTAYVLAPDDSLVLATEDGLTLWDWKRHRPERSIKVSKVARLSATASLLACGTEDSDIVVFDMDTWRPVKRIQTSQGTLNCLQWLPDGRLITAGSTGPAKIWDPHDVRLVGSLETPRPIITLSATGNRLAMGDDQEQVRILSLPELQPVTSLQTGSDRDPYDVFLSANGQQVSLSGGAIFDTTSGRRVGSWPLGAAGSSDGRYWLSDRGLYDANRTLSARLETGLNLISNISFSADGSRLAAANRDGVITVWDLATAQPVQDFPFTHPTDPQRGTWSEPVAIQALNWSHGPLAVVENGSQESIEWLQSHHRHTVEVSNDAALSGDGRTAVLSGTGTQVVDTATGRVRYTLPVKDSFYVALSKDGSIVACASPPASPGGMEVWSGRHRLWKQLCSHAAGQLSQVNHLAFSEDGRWLTVSTESGTEGGPHGWYDTHMTLQMVDVVRAQPRWRRALPFGGPCTVSPGGSLVAVGTGRSVTLVRAASGAVRSRLTADNEQDVLDVQFSPQGDRVAAGFVDGSIRVWNVSSGKLNACLDRRGFRYGR